MINFKSTKQFNKTRRRLLLGKDDLGNKIYPFDLVRVQIPHETRSSHCSIIYWNALDGAFINAHPAHISMKTSLFRNLRDYFQKESSMLDKITCFKINEKEYEQWFEENERKKLNK